jgi:hypothetical protein
MVIPSVGTESRFCYLPGFCSWRAGLTTVLSAAGRGRSNPITSPRGLQPTSGRGALQAYVKPGLYVGSDRGANWGVEVGVKLLGF